MVERLATIFGSFNEYLKVFYHLGLSVEIVKSQRSQGIFKFFFALAEPFFVYVEIFCHLIVYVYYATAKVRLLFHITK